MVTPYDWQEGIGNRASYIETRLEAGAPILAVSLDSGILVYTRRRRLPKVYEVYDRILFAALGQQSDVEALRIAALEFASREGFTRSEADVTIQRVVVAVSTPLKRAFGDFSSAPFLVRGLFAELGDRPDQDEYYALEYDGDYEPYAGRAVIAGSADLANRLRERVSEIAADLTPADATDALRAIYDEIVPLDPALSEEVVLLDRVTHRENRFRRLSSAK